MSKPKTDAEGRVHGIVKTFNVMTKYGFFRDAPLDYFASGTIVRCPEAICAFYNRESKFHLK